MTSRDIRRQFLDFFASKGHKIIPSAPMVAKSDPTLMFINSGMAPLKDFFLGNQTPPAKRIADTQKCLRVTGKHNDLEDVGFDGYHHTMFEMLGNWSFGDYFKKDALAWSWELLTEVYKIPKDRIYVSVFQGDEQENLPFDQEAFDTWKQFVSEDRILPFGKKENFWEMGAQGPCGPCSEIHVDLRSNEERAKTDGKALVNADDPNVIEIWNNVFMQFNRKADGSLEELPAKSVDTGMGFERLCRAVQGAKSNYDTDLWLPLFTLLESLSGITYTGTYPGAGDWKKTDVAMRVVADHLRAVSFAIADGELPSNTGAGYVIRRILRRAVRYYYSFLNLREPVLYRLCPVLAEEFSDVFPELKAQIDFVVKVILEEEKSFLRTLESGLKRIEHIEVQDNILPGEQAFELFDTFGFPIDLTRLIAKEKGWTVDDAGFDKALAEQKARSRKDAAKEVGDWVVLTDESDVAFVGYDELSTENAHIVKYRTVVTKGENQYHLVLNRTPFYPEGGGQVGDKGWLMFGTEKIQVLDTKKENTLIIHIVDKLPYDLENQTVVCQVDAQKRHLTENNHSVTHLLHAALRRVLGSHVQQKGSYLDENALRFDFAHFQKVSDQELAEIEHIVNEKIRENIALEEARNLPLEEAKKSGAMMLFGEKYGDTVRMITFDPTYSRELCGGCHVRRTGQIGYFVITGESAVSAGVRRIEAVTAEGAEQYVAELQQEYASVKNVLKTKDVVKGVMTLIEGRKQLEKQRDELYQWQASRFMEELKGAAELYQGVNLLVSKISLDDANVVKTLAQNLETAIEEAVIVLAFETADKAQISIRISENLVKERGLHAGRIIQELTKSYLDGGGGGQPTFAMGSGSNKKGLEAALGAIRNFIPEERQTKSGTLSPLQINDYQVQTSDFSKYLLEKFARQPFETHYKHSAWKYFTNKSADFQRNAILNRGRADFNKSYTDQTVDFTLQPYELVDLYCYYYMQMHYASSLAMFSVGIKVIKRDFLAKKDLLFLDLGCGPMTSGAAFVDFYNQATKSDQLRMYYVGFDNADDMLEKAQAVAEYLKPYSPQSRFEFATQEQYVLELISDFKQHFKQHERTAVIINLCYVMAAEYFDAEENLKKLADLIAQIYRNFIGQSVCLMYQNPVGHWHRNWEKLKSLLQEQDFGNRKERAGVINFVFEDVVGSWSRSNPDRSVRFEWFFNETV